MREKYIGICRPGGQYIGNGFGHVSAAAAELIVEAVFDAKLTPTPPETGELEPEPDCRTPHPQIQSPAHPAEP